MKCFNYIREYDTAMQPIYNRRCFCNTTACMNQDDFNVGSPIKNHICSCDECLEEATRAIENATYREIFT